MSKIFVDQVDPKTATTLTLGTSGDTVDIPSGVTLSGAGTITASAANLAASGAGGVTGTLPIANGGTGATTLAGAGLDNTPYYFVSLSANQTVSSGSWNKVNANTEIYDSAGAYDNSSNYRFTPLTAGYYYFSATVGGKSSTASSHYGTGVRISLNGSTSIAENYYLGHTTNDIQESDVATSALQYMNGSSDYIELWGYCQVNAGTPYIIGGTERGTHILGYKIIG
jgi:hypothetical protein